MFVKNKDMDIKEEINLRTAIKYCIEENDSTKATSRIMEFIKDDRKLQTLRLKACDCVGGKIDGLCKDHWS